MKDGLYWMRFLGGTSQHTPFIAQWRQDEYFIPGESWPRRLLPSDSGVVCEILGPATPPGKLFLLQFDEEGYRFGGVFSSFELAEEAGKQYIMSRVHEITVDEFITTGGMETFAIFDTPTARGACPSDTIERPAGEEGAATAYIQAASSEEALRKYKASQEQVVS